MQGRAPHATARSRARAAAWQRITAAPLGARGEQAWRAHLDAGTRIGEGSARPTSRAIRSSARGRTRRRQRRCFALGAAAAALRPSRAAAALTANPLPPLAARPARSRAVLLSLSGQPTCSCTPLLPRPAQPTSRSPNQTPHAARPEVYNVTTVHRLARTTVHRAARLARPNRPHRPPAHAGASRAGNLRPSRP